MLKVELENKLNDSATTARKVNEKINELLTYMNSEKFRCGNELDGYINIEDVRRYMSELRCINLEHYPF